MINISDYLKNIRDKLTFANKKELSIQTEHSALEKKLLLLKNRFSGAIHFIKKNNISKNGRNVSLGVLPWYLMIGSTGVGKTSLLANSNVKYVLEKQFNQPSIKIMPPSDACDWWITSDAVIIDTPGSYVAFKNNKPSVSNKIWQYFLDLIQKSRGNNALKGVIFAISVSELIDHDSREEMTNHLRYRINELQKKFGIHLPFYFVITKCDLIPGFLEFFNDCSSEELIQAWGITMPDLKVTESLTNIFTARFNELIKRLNNQIIYRLHQERNPYAKFYIKDFPLQIERLKQNLVRLFNSLSSLESNFSLKGVYLTSAYQDNLASHEATHPRIMPGEESKQLMQIMHAPDMPIYSYFIKQFIMQGIMQ